MGSPVPAPPSGGCSALAGARRLSEWVRERERERREAGRKMVEIHSARPKTLCAALRIPRRDLAPALRELSRWAVQADGRVERAEPSPPGYRPLAHIGNSPLGFVLLERVGDLPPGVFPPEPSGE